MPGETYYKKQAHLLFQMALASRDPARAARLRAQARVLLNLSHMSNEPDKDLAPLLDEFNALQMQKRRSADRP